MVALLSAGSLYLIFYVWFPERWKNLKIQSRTPGKFFIEREGRYTTYSLIVFAGIGALTDFLISRGWTQAYSDWGAYGYFYLILSVPIVLVLQDTYIYWAHRMLHWKPLYRWVHSWHHRFHNPTPLSAFAFHPIEGVVQNAYIPLIILFVPVHEVVMAGFSAFVFFITVYGHSGYELRAGKVGVWQIFNTSLHHNQHHTAFIYNYGIFLNFWDKWMGTNHPTYLAEFERLGNQKQHTTSVTQSSVHQEVN